MTSKPNKILLTTKSRRKKLSKHSSAKLFTRKKKKLVICVVIIALVAALLTTTVLLSSRHYPMIARYIDYIFYNPKLPESEIYGIDVSAYQKDIQWDMVGINYNILTRRIERDKSSGHKKVEFAIVKATEGATITDKKLEMNQKAIRQAGIKYGAYHFFSLTSNASDQANNFLKHSGLRKGDIAPVLDIENIGKLSVEELQTMALEWLRIVEKHYKCKPLIYTSASFRNKYLNTKDFEPYNFWIGHYAVDEPAVSCDFWQFTDKGYVDGISEYVDIDVFRRERKDFNKFILNY